MYFVEFITFKAPVVNIENGVYDMVDLDRSASSPVDNPDQINRFDGIENRYQNH